MVFILLYRPIKSLFFIDVARYYGYSITSTMDTYVVTLLGMYLLYYMNEMLAGVRKIYMGLD